MPLILSELSKSTELCVDIRKGVESPIVINIFLDLLSYSEQVVEYIVRHSETGLIVLKKGSS